MSGLAGHQEGLFFFFQEWEEKPLEGSDTEVKGMDCGARMSGFESHLCHPLAI